MANPRVTAGLMKASLLPQAMAANTPPTTAKAQPAVITIQPPPSAFDRFKSTHATTPSPSKISTRVPINSPRIGDDIIVFPLFFETPALALRLATHAARPNDRVTAFLRDRYTRSRMKLSICGFHV